MKYKVANSFRLDVCIDLSGEHKTQCFPTEYRGLAFQAWLCLAVAGMAMTMATARLNRDILDCGSSKSEEVFFLVFVPWSSDR